VVPDKTMKGFYPKVKRKKMKTMVAGQLELGERMLMVTLV
jgi:hypothetical protein